jgi:hypothetical protein
LGQIAEETSNINPLVAENKVEALAYLKVWIFVKEGFS